MPWQRREVNVFSNLFDKLLRLSSRDSCRGSNASSRTTKKKGVRPTSIDHLWRALAFEYLFNPARAPVVFPGPSYGRNYIVPG